MYYVSPNQVNIQIPYETQPGRANLVLSNPFENSNPYHFNVAASGPGIFTQANGSVTPVNTVPRGQIATIYITGDGQVSPSLPTGTAPSPQARTPKPQLPVTITVGGVQVATPFNFIGIPAGLVGVTQINFTVPTSVAPGVQPVVVTVGTASSNAANLTVQ